MLPNTWQASLRQWLSQQLPDSRLAIVGIGNTLRSDDAVGVLAARSICSRFTPDPKTALVIDAGHAPENITAELRCFAPEFILFIDAADMGELPGTIAWLELAELDGMSASTHTLPLSMLARYLTLELNCQIAVLGIQPRCNEVGEAISTEVESAITQVVDELFTVLQANHLQNES